MKIDRLAAKKPSRFASAPTAHHTPITTFFDLSPFSDNLFFLQSPSLLLVWGWSCQASGEKRVQAADEKKHVMKKELHTCSIKRGLKEDAKEL